MLRFNTYITIIFCSTSAKRERLLWQISLAHTIVAEVEGGGGVYAGGSERQFYRSAFKEMEKTVLIIGTLHGYLTSVICGFARV